MTETDSKTDDNFEKQDQESPSKVSKQKSSYTNWTAQDLLVFFKLFVPTVLCGLLTMLQEVTNLAFVGQLNDAAKLAGVGLGNTILNICGMAIILGLNLALETFVSQSYG